MARYEVAVNTPVAFRSAGTEPFTTDETVSMEFEDRVFVWHAGREHPGDQCWPVVTVMVDDADDYAEERLATNRFLSGLCFALDYPMSVSTSAATGYKAEFDPPLLGQPGYLPTILIPTVSGLVVSADDRLRLVLALYREGRSAESPFYRFLAFYNALDAAFDNDEPARDSFMCSVLSATPLPRHSGASDWADYLRDTLRNAVAHAVRHPGKPMLNPDDLTDRNLLDQPSDHLVGLIRRRVDARWPGGVQTH